MKLYKEDILCLCDYPEENIDSHLDLMAYYPGTNSDEILLREVLLKFGGYRIVEVICYEDVICFRTNLPYELYKEAVKNYLVVNNRKTY